MTTVNNLATPQALAVFELLTDGHEMTAKQIGAQLNVLPNAVYRSVEQLIDIGVVTKTDSYPTSYTKTAGPAALESFLLNTQKSFLNSFLSDVDPDAGQEANMSFINTRSDLLKMTDRDTSQAKRTINFIVSGLQVPDESILTYHRAVAKDIQIRALLQKRDDTSPGKLEKWRDIGVKYRFTNDLGIRMFSFDSKVLYLTSYDQSKKEEAQGVRIAYPHLAMFMDGIFEQKWATAKK